MANSSFFKLASLTIKYGALTPSEDVVYSSAVRDILVPRIPRHDLSGKYQHEF
jgi:hypothetical protein